MFILDSGATRNRRKPLKYITAEDEIPELPKNVLAKPNDADFEKQIKEIEEKIQKHYQSIEELNEQMKKEKYGNNPELDKLFEERKALSEQMKQLKEVTDEKNKKLDKNASAKIKHLRNEKDLLQREVETDNIVRLNAEIKSIQEKLGFAALTATEEKKLIEKKNKLEAMRPKVK